MIPSPLIDHHTHTNRSRSRSTGNAHARARPPILSALTPPTPPRNTPAGPPIAVLTGKTIRPTASIPTRQASRCDQIPIALGVQFRALARFGRRPHQRVDSLVMLATENLHNKRHHWSRRYHVYRSVPEPA